MKDLIKRAKERGLYKGEHLMNRETTKGIKQGFNSLNLLYKTPTTYSKSRSFLILLFRKVFKFVNKLFTKKFPIQDKHFDKELRHLGANNVNKNIK